MRQLIYMLDTNVLYNWLIACNPGLLKDNRFIGPETAERIRVFCENNENKIYIPDLVWVEFLSVMLHKEVDISADFNSTRQFVRNQETMVQQLELIVNDSPNIDWFNWDTDLSPYPDATDLLRDTDLIDERTFNWMKNNADRRNKPTEKLLDGMDSVILIYLNELGRQKKDDIVVLYTADYPLWRILPRIRTYQNVWFAQNTAAIFALFPEVRCGCWHNNPADILRKKKIHCKKCGRLPLNVPFSMMQ